MLAEDGRSLPLVISRQIHALDHEMARAIELRGRLTLLQDQLSTGNQPAMSEWLSALALMATYGKYFTATELKRIFENWKHTEAEWQPLISAVRHAIDRRIAPDALEAQPLARRWMDLSVRWMKGDFDLLMRWGEMCRSGSFKTCKGTGWLDAKLRFSGTTPSGAQTSAPEVSETRLYHDLYESDQFDYKQPFPTEFVINRWRFTGQMLTPLERQINSIRSFCTSA
jgi:hypothetical protein